MFSLMNVYCTEECVLCLSVRLVLLLSLLCFAFNKNVFKDIAAASLLFTSGNINNSHNVVSCLCHNNMPSETQIKRCAVCRKKEEIMQREVKTERDKQ